MTKVLFTSFVDSDLARDLAIACVRHGYNFSMFRPDDDEEEE